VRKKVARQDEEDATSMGGWLFADSFLALMIIFLATISFVPTIGGTVSGTGNVGNIAGGSYVKGLNLVYEDFDPVKIRQDILDFEIREEIPTNSEVLYAKVVGGFDAASEELKEGTFRALLFSAQLRNSDLNEFKNTKIDLGASEKLKPNQIVIRLTVAGA